ncbi:MAG: protein phosphatase 2C domain-containing protein [Anaerolineae bacterium]
MMDVISPNDPSARYVIRSETNQRENNEDSFLAPLIIASHPPVEVMALADGMGGHAYGEHVSRETLHKVSLALFDELVAEPSVNGRGEARLMDAEMLGRAIMNALEQVNDYVIRMVETNKWGKAGSTIVIVGILDDTAVAANLGDSPLFHYRRKDGVLVKVTEDHTVAGVLLRAGLISPEMARFHEGRSRLEFYVGAPKLPKEAPLHTLRLEPGDLLLLCSDGISGAVPEATIEAVIGDRQRDLEKMADGLIEASLAAGETDNQTLILRQYGGEAPFDTARSEVTPSTVPSHHAGAGDADL